MKQSLAEEGQGRSLIIQVRAVKYAESLRHKKELVCKNLAIEKRERWNGRVAYHEEDI